MDEILQREMEENFSKESILKLTLQEIRYFGRITYYATRPAWPYSLKLLQQYKYGEILYKNDDSCDLNGNTS